MQASTKPLVSASAVGYEAMVQLLLENNADINTMDQVGSLSCTFVFVMSSVFFPYPGSVHSSSQSMSKQTWVCC